jgi:hypothetical protein
LDKSLTIRIIAEAIIRLATADSRLLVISEHVLSQEVRKVMPGILPNRLDTVVRLFEQWGCLEYTPTKASPRSSYYIADLNKSCLKHFVSAEDAS